MFTILAAAMYLYNVLRERLPIETQHLTYRNTAFNLPPPPLPHPFVNIPKQSLQSCSPIFEIWYSSW